MSTKTAVLGELTVPWEENAYYARANNKRIGVRIQDRIYLNRCTPFLDVSLWICYQDSGIMQIAWGHGWMSMARSYSRIWVGDSVLITNWKGDDFPVTMVQLQPHWYTLIHIDVMYESRLMNKLVIPHRPRKWGIMWNRNQYKIDDHPINIAQLSVPFIANLKYPHKQMWLVQYIDLIGPLDPKSFPCDSAPTPLIRPPSGVKALVYLTIIWVVSVAGFVRKLLRRLWTDGGQTWQGGWYWVRKKSGEIRSHGNHFVAMETRIFSHSLVIGSRGVNFCL